MIKNKFLFKNISLFLCLVPMLLLSLFCLVPNNEILDVRADYVSPNYEYIGNELFYLSTFVVNNGSNEPQVKTIVFDLTLSYGKLKPNYIALSTDAYIFDSNTTNQTPYSLYFSNWDNASQSIPQITANSRDRKKLRFQPAGEPYWIPVYFKTVGDFNCDVVSVKLETIPANSTNSIFSDWDYFFGNRYNIIQLTYTDSLNNLFVFQFFTLSSVNLTPRVYYLSPDFSDSTIYNEGYNSGYNAGLSDGTSTGYNDGYSAGESVGYGNGYNDGLEQSNNYSFLSLIGAVIDAPVTAFTSLLNFNLLGFNMLGFVTGLLTLSLIIFIVKLILGGK